MSDRYIQLNNYPELNVFITDDSFPEDTVRNSNDAVLSTTMITLTCPDCNNVFTRSASGVRKNRKNLCPYCSGSKSSETKPKKLRDGIASLADDDPMGIVAEWSEKNDYDPSYVSRSSTVKCWWKCGKCGGEWLASVNTRRNGSGCPECYRNLLKQKKEQSLLEKEKNKIKNLNKDNCVKPRKILATETNNVKYCYPEIMKYWVDERDPEKFCPKTKVKFKFKCDNGHCFEKTPSRFVSSGFKCMECNKDTANNFKPENSLEAKAEQELLDELIDPEIDPKRISYASKRKVLWKCGKCGNEWEAVVYSRYYGSGCPKCGRIEAYNHSSSLGERTM